MSNRALLRVKLSREARSELEQLATNYKSEILFDALNGIGDGDRECEITAEQLRAAAEAHGHVTVSSNIQHGIVYPDSARRAGNQSRPWLVVGVSIFVGACVLIAAKLIPIVIHDEQIQVLITLPIIGIVFLLIGGIGMRAQRGKIGGFHLPRFHLPRFSLPRLPPSKAAASSVTASKGNSPSELPPPPVPVGRVVADRWRSTTNDLSSRMLQLGAWLPAALFSASVAMLLQFRSARSVNFLNAARALTADPVQAVVIMVPLLVITTVVTQVFCFAAVRTLEGYWRRGALIGSARTIMIRRHVRRKKAIIEQRRRATLAAFHAALPNLLLHDGNISGAVARAVEAHLSGIDSEIPDLKGEEHQAFANLLQNWQGQADAWRLAKVDHLLNEEKAYPVISRILPTKLGNSIRATEDQLQHTDGDLQNFVLQRRDVMSSRQYDHSRNRLEMCCILVFVSAALVALTPIVLIGSGIAVTAVAIISGSFAILGVASYRAAIASAGGYCAALKQMDELPESPTRLLVAKP